MSTATDTQPLLAWGERSDRTIVQLPLEKIHVPPEYERDDSPREDEALTNSIRRKGVEQAIHVVPDKSGDYTLVKGTRRLAISYVCRYPNIPAIIEPAAPDVVDPVQYRHRLRFHLSNRQDLTPSQRAEFIVQAIEKFQMTQKDVAVSLGVDPGSISNYLAIRRYIPEIVQAIDRGEITAFHGRSFDGLTEAGQRRVWRTLRKQIAESSGHQAHRLVREKFGPKQFPEYYTAPAKTLAKLSRGQGKRKSRKRPTLTKSEQEILASDLNVKEAELRELEAEKRELRRINILCGPIVNGILRNDVIAALLPESMIPKLHRFSEIY